MPTQKQKKNGKKQREHKVSNHTAVGAKPTRLNEVQKVLLSSKPRGIAASRIVRIKNRQVRFD